MKNLVDINLLAKEKLLKLASRFIINSSEKTMQRIAYLLELMAPKKDKPFFKNIIKTLNKDNPQYQIYRRILIESNENFCNKSINNLLIKGAVLNQAKRNEAVRNGSAVPTVVLVSPTMRCNLSCYGCYANNYSRKDDLDFATVDRIIDEGKEMGVAFFTFLGGEPFLWESLFSIIDKHSDAFFLIFTNGTLIDEKAGKTIAELGNVMPIVSIEGSEEDTNERRGNNVYKKIMSVMEILKGLKIPFGYSITVTRKNIYFVTSDEFFKFMIDKGAVIGWYFIYMPIGRDFDLSLMPEPQERIFLKDRIHNVRRNLPLFAIDFWGDAPYVGGCIAGKRYIHINHKGDVEPCIFTHFAEVNIKNSTLKEAMNCEYFKEIRKRQPYSENLYLPCMLIDSPSVSRELFNCCNIYSTDNNSERLLFEINNEIDRYSEKVKPEYDRVWEKEKDRYKR